MVEQIHRRIVAIARDHRVAAGRRMRVDTTVVETNIHYPTDSNLLGDGVRVLTRMMKKVTEIAGAAGAKLRDRRRSVKRRGWRSAGRRAPKANRIAREWRRPTKDYSEQPAGWSVKPSALPRRSTTASSRRKARGKPCSGLRLELESMVPLVQQVIRQTKARVFAGDTTPRARSSACLSPPPK